MASIRLDNNGTIRDIHLTGTATEGSRIIVGGTGTELTTDSSQTESGSKLLIGGDKYIREKYLDVIFDGYISVTDISLNTRVSIVSATINTYGFTLFRGITNHLFNIQYPDIGTLQASFDNSDFVSSTYQDGYINFWFPLPNGTIKLVIGR